MRNCPECENPLDVQEDEVEEGDIVACDECGAEYEIVGTEPLELAHVHGDGLDEDDDELLDEEEEED
jgi:alpha-aminoadipate carrier protein LysW